MQPTYRADNTRFAYQLRFHIGFQTNSRQDIFDTPEKCQWIQYKLKEVCDFAGFHLLESKVQTDRLNLLVSLKPDHSPAQVVQTIKCNLSRLWNREYTTRCKWSRGYFFRSVGDATVPVVLEYLANQKEHHKYTSNLLASFCNPVLTYLMSDEKYSHSAGQFVLHLVLSPPGHLPVFDPEIAHEMLDQLLKTSVEVEGEVMRAEILEDHLHMLIKLPPHQTPASIALAMMNQTEKLFRQEFPDWFKAWGFSKVWNHSAYVGSIGCVDSKCIRRYLQKDLNGNE